MYGKGSSDLTAHYSTKPLDTFYEPYDILKSSLQ